MKLPKVDPYVLALLATVTLASIFPVRGETAAYVATAAKLVVGFLFFLHGAKLSREAVISGITHWRLHLTVLSISFVLFPILGLLITLTPEAILPKSMSVGILFLCCLPSTVQASIAFTSIARGNVAAAVCSASASNLFAMVATPALVGLLMHVQGAGLGWEAVQAILVQLLLPFIAGQLLRPWLIGLLQKHSRIIGVVDRGSVLIVVYSAFSAAVAGGVWSRIAIPALIATAVVCAVLLAVVLIATRAIAQGLKFDKADEITIVFCGSKKSLVTGAPMAAILFAPAVAGLMIIPLMLFHQMQLMACAVIAQKYAGRPNPESGTT
ncbi:sodium/bile acid cotransporter 7 [Caulobacter ginsengisoli]|uniref:Sodium/bile acid cotransporter 7 n=1 Tax=Caulobacter ginsengisoli TaxID=400775 RepID=A0ABU0IPU3_9CAUL|nr:bile acid:sodium symporter family protein [Caulobacter ginsengisoli]MDQ0464031.1 sodium/bile acid cotransporter 7 [Caulobacter ginsengisoli]